MAKAGSGPRPRAGAPKKGSRAVEEARRGGVARSRGAPRGASVAVALPEPAARSEELTLKARVRELESQLSELHEELLRSERRVEAMKQIGRALGSNLQLDSLLLEIVQRTTDLLEADRSTLFLVDRERRELWSKVLEGNELREIRLPFGVGLAGWVAEEGKPLHIDNAYADARFNPEIDRRSGYRTRCMLVWPVRHPQSAEILGVVQVLNKKVGPFNPTDERLLEAIASEIGVALEVATLYKEAVARSEALERTQRDLLLLFETERAISQSDDLRAMLETILDTALATMHARAGAVHVLDERGRGLEVLAARGTHAASLRQAPVAVGEGLVGEVAKGGEPVRLEGVEGTRRGRIEVKSLLAVPISTKQTGILGVFELINRRDRSGFSERDLAALEVVAGQAGRAIAAERRRKEREQSERLTTIGRMLSGVMHDLRTPMTLISGYTQMLAASEIADERAQFAHQVNKQVDLLAAMTRDLLAFARGERSVLIRKVYVQRFMEEMREYLTQELEGTGVALEMEVAHRGTARFDETKMRRVFHNIARNAREAMPGGGRFRVTVAKEGSELAFHFDDTGPGVPAALADRLFEPFASAGKIGGTGLGLAMVKQIAEEHRGAVSYESTPKKGTRFSLRIPA